MCVSLRQTVAPRISRTTRCHLRAFNQVVPKAAHDKQLAALKEKFDRVLLEYVACPREAFSGPRSDYSARPGGRASLNPKPSQMLSDS